MVEQLVLGLRVSRRTQQVIWFTSMTILVGAVALFGPGRAARASGERCFEAGANGITACISGRFLEFWEMNGGLARFGYPLTMPQVVNTRDGAFLTQYFERARFELHSENEPPYDVLLGRVGAELLERQGRDIGWVAPEVPVDGCQYWAETQRNTCGPFLEAWRAHALHFNDAGERSDVERLALWGLPITGVEPMSTDVGIVLVQWFERARIEQQPDGSITFGRLGAEMQQARPAPAPVVAAQPEVAVVAPVVPTAVLPPNVPSPGEPCNVGAPAPAEGLQLWMADQAPMRSSDAVACVRLILNGQAVRGANAVTYRYRGDERRPSIAQSTGYDGVASFIFYIGEETPGARIPVEAVVTFRGNTYTAYSEFTPQ